ncbi:MAG: hypothetical protein KAQ72_00075, partial [Desulfobacula sp.]|nr:hypothetical protein [Desulfobacula sp.]
LVLKNKHVKETKLFYIVIISFIKGCLYERSDNLYLTFIFKPICYFLRAVQPDQGIQILARQI